MLLPRPTGEFNASYKYLERLGWDMQLLDEVIEMLINEEDLPDEYNEHMLEGNLAGTVDCHLSEDPDWVLVYKVEDNALKLIATGSHNHVFGGHRAKRPRKR